MLNLEGRTAIVTGAGRGIGREIALLLGEHHVAVAAVDVNLKGAAETVSILERNGSGGLALECDVGDARRVEECLSGVLSWRDRVHFLVNNAGITRDNLLLRMREEEWDGVLDVNLKGTFNFTKTVARHMIKNRFGRIVNISSVIGVMGNAGQSNYAASKAGIIGFTKAVAKELAGRNITVNAVAPGFIETAMTEALPEKRKEEMRGMIPLGRFGSGRDVANAVLFLLSELGSYVTGHVLHCDGGMVI